MYREQIIHPKKFNLFQTWRNPLLAPQALSAIEPSNGKSRQLRFRMKIRLSSNYSRGSGLQKKNRIGVFSEPNPSNRHGFSCLLFFKCFQSLNIEKIRISKRKIIRVQNMLIYIFFDFFKNMRSKLLCDSIH